MLTSPLASFQTYFADIEDPRVEGTRCHELLDLIRMATCAVICGDDDGVDGEAWGNAKLDRLRQRGPPLPNGISSHDTFGDVLGREARAIGDELSALGTGGYGANGGKLALDGKTLRRSRDRRAGKSAIQPVSTWASASHLLLGLVKVDEQSNGITAIPTLLEILALGGATVTNDAIGTQTETARAMVDRGADDFKTLRRPAAVRLRFPARP